MGVNDICSVEPCKNTNVAFQLPLEKLGLEKTQMSIHTYTDKLPYTNDNIMRFVLIQKKSFYEWNLMKTYFPFGQTSWHYGYDSIAVTTIIGILSLAIMVLNIVFLVYKTPHNFYTVRCEMGGKCW